jgi:hypothetical protein
MKHDVELAFSDALIYVFKWLNQFNVWCHLGIHRQRQKKFDASSAELRLW